MQGLFCCLFLVFFEATSSFQWTSTAGLHNGTVIPACAGQDVSLPWGYALNPGEHVITVEWHYQAPGQANKLLAVESSGNFLPVPGMSQNINRTQGAGLQIDNVKLNEEGVYSVTVHYDLHGASHTQTQSATVQIPSGPVADAHGLRAVLNNDAVYDTSTHDWRVQISCEGLVSLGQPPVSIVWRTPSGAVVPSTSRHNATYILTLPNPPEEGDYACLPVNSSTSGGCGAYTLHDSSPAHVTGYDARFAVMDARMRELQQQNADLMHTVQTLTSSPHTVTGQPLNYDLVQEVMNLTVQNRELSSQLESALHIINQQALQIQNLTSELDHVIAQQTTMTSDIGLLKYLTGDPLRVGDRVVRGRDWSWQNQDGSPPGPGTVVAVPADQNHPGWVKVHWDTGNTDVYRMGDLGLYDLKLL